MQWWDSAENLYRIASWLTVATFAAPLLFGILALYTQNRARHLDSRVIESLRYANQQLEERIQPRTFTVSQDETFLDVLRKAPSGKVQLLWLGSNPEAENLGKHIAVLLERASWIVDKGGYSADPTPVGLEIHVQSEGNAPPHMATLREALKSVGYQISLVEKRDSPRNDWLWLVVGHKP
jgi:hypothetical protein